MKNVTRIVIIALCAALALCSCKKNRYTPEETKIPLGFTAVSQVTSVSAATKALTAYDKDGFGVWGIARHPNIVEPYTLWTGNQFMYARKNASGYYMPDTDAYWMGGYTYRFFACAPYNNGSDENLTEFTVVPATATTKDAVSFKYNMSNKAYNYDLLGAAAETFVEVGATQQPQNLTFWHLLSKINITISIVDALDASGKPTNVVNVSRIAMKGVSTQAVYTIKIDGSGNLDVDCSPVDGVTNDIVFNSATGEVNILPQDVVDVVLELDFTVGEGANAIQTSNYWIDMGVVHELVGKSTAYRYNAQYNWDLSISPKNIIFDVEVTDWIAGGKADEIPSM